MKERIRKRKLDLIKRRRLGGTDSIHNQTAPVGLGHDLASPNLSRISGGENKLSGQNETIDAEMMDSSMLNNLNQDLDVDARDSDGEYDEEDPE